MTFTEALARQFTQEQMFLISSTALGLTSAFLANAELRREIIARLPRLWGLGGRGGIAIGRERISDQARLRHTHIVGATGTGKTVLIEKLLFQDLERGYGAIIIDPKGERSFFESVRAHCARIGREKELHLLSATFPDESRIWNPCGLGNASELQTKFFNSAIYSEPHYAKACEYGLLQAFRVLCQGRPYGFTIRDLAQELESISEDDKNETLKGLFFDLNNLMLGEWEEILTCRPRKEIETSREISILDVVRNNQILFVDLPTEGKRVQSSRIGRLLTQEIILISGMRKRNASLKSDRPFSVYIDEFDAFATESFATFLNKGRSSEFMIHLAHQTLSDLNCVSPEFAGQILGNCNVRFIFRQDDPDDAERWSRFIGTQKVIKRTYRTTDGQATGEASNRESQEFVISPDLIKNLKVGRCIFSMKTEGRHVQLRVPFENASPQIQSSARSPSPSLRGVGLKPHLTPGLNSTWVASATSGDVSTEVPKKAGEHSDTAGSFRSVVRKRIAVSSSTRVKRRTLDQNPTGVDTPTSGSNSTQRNFHTEVADGTSVENRTTDYIDVDEKNPWANVLKPVSIEEEEHE